MQSISLAESGQIHPHHADVSIPESLLGSGDFKTLNIKNLTIVSGEEFQAANPTLFPVTEPAKRRGFNSQPTKSGSLAPSSEVILLPKNHNMPRLLAAAPAPKQAEQALTARDNRLTYTSQVTVANEKDQRPDTKKADLEPTRHWLGKLLNPTQPHKDGEFYRNEGIRLNNRSRYRQAVKMLERAMELGVDDQDCQLNLGIAYTRLGRLDAAINLLTNLGTARPDDPAIATLLGKAHLFNSQYHEAVQVMAPVAQKHRDRFNLHFYLGLAHAKQKSYDLAAEVWFIAARIRPEHQETRELINEALDAKQHFAK